MPRIAKIAAWTVVLVALSLPATAFLTAASAPHPPLSNATLKPPVTIHFKPKTATGTQGGSVTIHALVHNNGTYAFIATSCNLWYRLGNSGSWTKAGTCLTVNAFPHTFAAKSKQKFSDTQRVSMTFPVGTYQWKVQLVGTYNGHAAVSHTGIITVKIT